MTHHDLDLSILEFGYTTSDGRLRNGLESTLKLAALAEACGYSRFWFTEHHGTDLTIACPEIMIAAVAAKTSRIRVGSAGILLNYYSPYKVAEVFHTLATLFPGRIDLGLARGIGASPEVADLLRDDLPKVETLDAWGALFERKLTSLIGHLRAAHDAQGKRESTAQLPAMPDIWLHGQRSFSAALAAKLGTKLTMALWQVKPENHDHLAEMNAYRANFQRAPNGPEATGCISLSGVCAETEAEVETLVAAAKQRLGDVTVNFCGTPERCRDTIVDFATRFGVREVLIHAQFIEGYEGQARMYRLIAEVML